MVHVVAALIREGERLLICQRPAGKKRGLLWEFVGGKVEPGETPQEALVRECREELGITVEAGEVYVSLIHEYPDLTIRLTLYNARILAGTPCRLEHNDLRFIRVDEIDDYPFCPADEAIIAMLKKEAKGREV